MINDLCCTISGSDKIIVDHTDSYNLGARATTGGWNFLYACEADRLGLLFMRFQSAAGQPQRA